MERRGERIRKLRKAKGLNQTQLGDLVGVDQSVITDYELYDAEPGAEKLVSLAEHLGVSAEFLMRGQDLRTWPFPRVSIERFTALDDEARGFVQARLLQAIEEAETQPSVSHAKQRTTKGLPANVSAAEQVELPPALKKAVKVRTKDGAGSGTRAVQKRKAGDRPRGTS